MHLYVIARGIANQLNQWENELSVQFVPFKHHPDQPPGRLQLAMRPIRMYEIAFPEPCLNDVLKLIQPSSTKSWNPKYDKYLWMMQKALALQKMPVVPERNDNTHFLLNRDFVEVAGLGIKPDNFVNPTKGIEQI